MTHYCLQCYNGTELIYRKQDITVMCHDKTAVASGIEGWHCPICGECEFANEADSRRHMDTLSALIANVKTFQTYREHESDYEVDKLSSV